MPRLLSKKTHFTVLKRKSVKTRSYSPGETQWLVSEDQRPVKQHSYFMRTQTTTPTALFVLSGAHSAVLLSN